MSLKDVVDSPFDTRLFNRAQPVTRQANQRGGGFTLPKQKPPNEPWSPFGRAREVRVTQYYWLPMPVPFTATAGEQKQAASQPQQFPLLIKGAWSDLTEVRARFVGTATGIPLSTQQVPLLTEVGNSDLAHPLLYWRKPYFLQANSSLSADFTNDGGEEAGTVVFYCERPNLDQIVPVKETMPYNLLLDLGLDGVANSTGNATTQQIEYDLLIYGALSTSLSMKVRFVDSQQNIAWSQSKLPIGAFAGIQDPGVNVQPIIYFSTPYYLPRNASIMAEWENTGSEDGGFVSFICERILR